MCSEFAQRTGSKLVAAAAAAGLVLTPAFATGTPAKKRAPAITLSFDPISSFTPANADPKLAAALSGKALALTDFKFTPAAAKNRPSQVRVAIRARTFAPARLAEASAPASPINQLTPTGYNLGVAVGWHRFAVAGDVAQVKKRRPGARRPRERRSGGQLFAQQPAEHARRGRRRADIGQPAAGASPRRQCLARRRRVLFAVPPHRPDRRRPLQYRARQFVGPAGSSAATARRSTSAPPSSSSLSCRTFACDCQASLATVLHL